MQTIAFACGTSIQIAAQQLVRSAPAKGDFNGIIIRARYSTTRPRDIVRQWTRTSEERSALWLRSPEGLKYREDEQRRTTEAQRVVNECVDTLTRVGPSLFDAPSAVLSWLDRIAMASDNVGVKYDRTGIVRLFGEHGWKPNANCGAEFNGEDQRNFAGWIVGQWLASGYPNVSHFIEQWRKKFATT